MPETKLKTIYGIDDMPPLREGVPLGLQHVLAMFLSNIAVPLIIANAVGMSVTEKAFLVQMALVLAGLATIVQSYPLGAIGARMPIVMGTSFAFVAGIISIIKEFNLASAFGACLAAAVVELVIAFNYDHLKRFFPPLTTGIVVMLIGLTLIPVGIDYAAGGIGAPDYGSIVNLSIAGIVLVTTLVLNQFLKGFASYASMIVGVFVGYIVAAFWGQIDLSHLSSAAWFQLPKPLHFGLEFHLGPVILMSFVYVVSSLETLGDITGTTAAVGRLPTSREMKGGLTADGVMSGVAALFGAFPNTSYSQNVGLVNFTGVVSRHVAGIGGGFLLILGLIPKVGALVSTIPPPVIGGASLIMFAMIFASGLMIIQRGVVFNRRNLVIIAVSVALGLGVEFRPEVLHALPQTLQPFLKQGLVVGGLCGFILNLVFPDSRT